VGSEPEHDPSADERGRAKARVPRGRAAFRAPITEGPCLHVGVDENGLGPLLGPLVVTGVAFRLCGARPTSLGQLVGDSKALVSHADVSLGEAWARALLGALGSEPASPADIVTRLSIDDEATLRAPCPEPSAEHAPEHHASAMCWPTSFEDEPFVAEESLVERCRRVVRGWSASERIAGRFARKNPIELVGVRSAIVCPSRLNELHATGRNKFFVDLHSMERVALALDAEGRAKVDAPLDAICGKVGGMDYYSGNFGPLSSRLCAIEREGPAGSAYRFPGLGRFTFLRDADASDPFVGLASLVGKYLRELLMGRVVRYMRRSLPSEKEGEILPNVSGYRDPETRRFIDATSLIRTRRSVPDRCFQRNS